MVTFQFFFCQQILLSDRLKQSRDALEKLFADLKSDYKVQRSKLTNEQRDEDSPEMAILHKRFKRTGEVIAQEYDKCVGKCYKSSSRQCSFNRFLADSLPKFNKLPVSLTVDLLPLNICLDEMRLQPQQR